MTIHQLPGATPNQRPEPEPRRSGQPWTTEDYETLVDRCRAGASLAELASVLERRESAVLPRAKRLLPLEQRGVPPDRVLPHLHRLLTEDLDYDWAHHLAATPPPRPVINYLPAPQVCRGIPGLSDEELLAVAGLAVRLGVDAAADDLRPALSSEIEMRDLDDELASTVARDAEWRLREFRAASRYVPYTQWDRRWDGDRRWDAKDDDWFAEPYDAGPPPDSAAPPPEDVAPPPDDLW